jgi:hypothetical protein
MYDENENEMLSNDFALKMLDTRLSRYEWEINRLVAMLNSETLTDTQKITFAIRMASSIQGKA